MNAAELLKEILGRGVQIIPDGGQLRLRPKSSLTPELVSQVREHKLELLQLLASDACPRVADALGGPEVSEDDSVLIAEVVAMPLKDFAKAGLVVQVRSEVLGEAVIFASDNAIVDPGERRVVYRARELRLLLGADPKHIRTLHSAKKAFGGTIEVS